MAHKIVGVGSVGSRAWIVLLLVKVNRDPLFLQVKEAQAAVLEPGIGRASFATPGGGRGGPAADAGASDIFLGRVRHPKDDSPQRDYYVRQLWDCKTSLDLEAISPAGL